MSLPFFFGAFSTRAESFVLRTMQIFVELHFEPLRLRMAYIFRCICCIFPHTIAVSI